MSKSVIQYCKVKRADERKRRDEKCIGSQMRGKGGVRVGLGRKADERKGRGEGGAGKEGR